MKLLKSYIYSLCFSFPLCNDERANLEGHSGSLPSSRSVTLGFFSLADQTLGVATPVHLSLLISERFIERLSSASQIEVIYLS